MCMNCEQHCTMENMRLLIPAHFEDATWQNDKLYAVFNKTVNTNIRITGLLYYAPVTVLNNGNI